MQNSLKYMSLLEDRSPELEKNLWDEMDARLVHHPLNKADVLLVGFMPDDTYNLVEYICFSGGQFSGVTPTVGVLDDEKFMAVTSHVFVNLSAFSDLDRAITTLMKLREKHLHITIILCSNEIKGDDFGTERLPIADATMRLPTTVQNFTRALDAAEINSAPRLLKLRRNLDL